MPEASGVKRSAIQAKRFLNCNMFQDFDSYLLSLRKAASEPQPKLLQAPLFLRPQKGDLDYRQGVQYLDLQVLDIQPNVADGVFDYQVQFLKLFLLFNVVQTTDPEKLTTAAQRFYQVANEDPTQPSQARPRVTAYLQEMREFATKFFPKTDYQTALDKMTQVVANETQAPTAQLALEFAQSGLFQFGQQLAAKNQRILTGEPYQLRGYTDKSLEIQQFIGSAIELGLNYRFLDGTGEFLQLRSQQQSAIINARITAKNPLILQAILADQQAMNNLLGFAQVAVPKGFVATDLTVAKSLFHAEFEKSGVVIAPQNGPKTAQQVFTTPIDEHTFTTSFLEALDYDDTVVVKAFIPGSVYDFYILDQRILAILEQVPVNVVGDGQSDIESLIDQKNDDDRRGRLGQRPLVTIPKTAATAAFLAQHQQNYQTIPDRGEQVFLSAIADLAAGGDSFDVYEEVDQSYQKLVLRIAQTLNMQQGHVAMIIPNIYAPYQPQPNSAIVTDVAAAVSIIPYSFPFAGNQRKLSQVIIQSLFSNSAKERQMIDQQDFDVFKDPTLAGRLVLIRSQVDPKFEQIGARYATQFTQQSQFQFYVHIAKHLRRHKNPPPDTWLAIGEGKRGYKMLPHFEIGLWPNALFIWLAYLAEVDQKPVYAAKLATLPNLYPDLTTSGLMLAQDHTQQ